MSYHTTPSSRVSSNPLLGLNAIGAIYTFYKTPTYFCLPSGKLTDRATDRCAKVKADKGYQIKYHDRMPPEYLKRFGGEPGKPHVMTLQDEKFFNPCSLLRNKCAEPVPLPPPVPTTYPKPPVTTPAPPTSPETPTTVILPPPTPVAPPYQPPPPLPPPAYQQPEQPVQVFNPPVYQDSGDRADDIDTEPEPLPPVEDEDNGSVYMVGGILFLLAGGGLAYYLSKNRKKKRR